MPTRGGQKGFALLLVLWGLALVSLLFVGFAGRARTELTVSRNLTSAAKAERLAEAGIALGALRLLADDPADRGSLAGGGFALDLGDGRVLVSLQEEGGKLDLNAAPDGLLENLFAAAGLGEEERGALLQGLRDWRRQRRADLARAGGGRLTDEQDPAQPAFLSVDELRGVPGMTEEAYLRLRPFLTVQTGAATVNPWTAPLPVLRAVPGLSEADAAEILRERAVPGAEELPVAEAFEAYLADSGSQVVCVRAEAVLSDGTRVVREALVTPGSEPERPYRVLAWRRG